MKKFTIKIEPVLGNGKLPGVGHNPAAITGNASGAHRIEKGKGSKYNRARSKARDRRNDDE